MADNKQNAERVAEAVKRLAESPEALDNFKSYLTRHFDAWLKEYASTPDGLANELEAFSKIK